MICTDPKSSIGPFEFPNPCHPRGGPPFPRALRKGGVLSLLALLNCHNRFNLKSMRAGNFIFGLKLFPSGPVLQTSSKINVLFSMFHAGFTACVFRVLFFTGQIFIRQKK
jgi:hypothetical protein